MAIIAGVFIDKFTNNRIITFLGMAAGTIVCYGFGTAWLAYQAHLSWKQALFAGVIPFILGDAAKMAIAACLGPEIRKQLIRAGLFF